MGGLKPINLELKIDMPINSNKSGILNIAPRINSHKIVSGSTLGNYPIFKQYRYLSVPIFDYATETRWNDRKKHKYSQDEQSN